MLIKLAWRNIWRNKKRSFITITAIVVAVFLAILMRSMQLGMYDNMIQNVVGSYSGHVQIHFNGFWEEQTRCGEDGAKCQTHARLCKAIVWHPSTILLNISVHPSINLKMNLQKCWKVYKILKSSLYDL